MKLSMNLERRSVLIIAIVLFLALGLNTIVLTYVASDKYEQATLSRATYVAENLVKDINKALNLGLPLEYIDGLNEKFKALVTDDSSLAYVMITDTKGKVLFHSDETSVGQELNDPISQKAVNETDILIQEGDSAYDISHVLVDASDDKVGVLRVGVKAEVIKQQLYGLLKWAVGISVICFVFFVWIVYFSVSRFIANPIMEMEKVATMISNGDLTKEVGSSGKDEILKLSLAINNMATNLREMITKVQENTGSINMVSSHIGEASQRVLTAANVQKEAVEETASAINETNDTISAIAISSEKLTDSAQDASSAVSEMTMSISRVSESSHIFSDSAQETASSIEEMIASIKEIAKSLDMLSSSSEDTASALLEVNATIKEIEQSADESVRLAEKVSADASEKGMEAVVAASKGMEEIKGRVGTLSESINRLESRSEEIGQILTVIDDVADQTNLLALNAAILAAQAGENGEAFAVVAEEIKGLAERTSVSTKEIANLINAVQTETRSSVEMTADGLQSVNKGIMLVSEVSQALRSIHESSLVSTEMSRAIQRATQEEANVIRQITDSIRGMTEQVEHISKATKEQSKGSKLVMDAAEKIKELAEHIKQATGEQMLGSQQIAEVSENVSLQAEQIMQSISSQKKKNAEIAGSMEKIKRSTRELDEASTDLDMVINSIKEASQALLTEIQKFLV